MIDTKLVYSVIATVLTIALVTPLISPLWRQVVFVIFAIYTTPLLNLRKRFRSIVYGTDSWTINVKPVFLRELRALLVGDYLEDGEQQVMAWKYRIYLLGYTLLLLAITVL